MMQLQSMLSYHDISSIAQIRQLIDQLTLSDGSGAFWLHRDGNCELGLFLNGPLAAVYRSKDCAWSHSPDQPEDELAEFTLENGQVDDFPLSHCVPSAEGIAAFLETAGTGELSARIKWH